jgi:MOSC domain-containing protein YiiM
VHPSATTANATKHRVVADSEAILDFVRASPRDNGALKLIVLRLPDEGRKTLEQATLSTERGVTGDQWGLKAHTNTGRQISVINARFLGAIAGSSERMPLSGDNLVVDLDLHEDNLPAGTRLWVGSALTEVTDHPHTGCVKFERRYGKEMLDLTYSPEGRALRLRGLFVRVIQGGEVCVGDIVRKEAAHT